MEAQKNYFPQVSQWQSWNPISGLHSTETQTTPNHFAVDLGSFQVIRASISSKGEKRSKTRAIEGQTHGWCC